MAQERDCPKCPFTPLEPREEQGLQLDECPKCGGRWFDCGELKRWAIDPERFQEGLRQGLLRPRDGQAACPACHQPMTNAGIISEFLRVDICERCMGIWLDKNELGVLDRLLKA